MTTAPLLFHFTDTASAKDIRYEGINPGPSGYVWLTGDPFWHRQLWADELEIPDRIDRRIHVELPESAIGFLRLLRDCFHLDEHLAAMAALNGAKENWWLYRARIKPEWLHGIAINPRGLQFSKN